MSLQRRWNDEIPADTAELGDTLLEPDDPYRLVGQEASSFFRFEDFISLYESIGRGAICPIVLSLVTIPSTSSGQASNSWRTSLIVRRRSRRG